MTTREIIHTLSLMKPAIRILLIVVATIALCAATFASGRHPSTPPTPAAPAASTPPVAAQPAPTAPTPATTQPASPQPGGPAPDFTIPTIAPFGTFTLSEYESRPVLLFFFDAGDMPSIHAFPYVAEWYRRYTNDSLVVMGIHVPEYPPMMDVGTVLAAASRENAYFPIAMDSLRSVYAAYGVEELPAYVVLKPGRKIVLQTSAARPYVEVETGIQKVLTGIKPDIINPYLVKPLRPVDDPANRVLAATSQVTLGCGFDTISGFSDTECDSFCRYKDLGEKIRGLVYLNGFWKVTPNSIIHTRKMGSSGDYLRVVYSGKEVWLLPSIVFETSGRIYVKQDGGYIDKTMWGRDIGADELGNPYVILKYSVPVQVIVNRTFGTHILELMPAEGDVALYYIFFEDGVAE